jgi:hypothetical protein
MQRSVKQVQSANRFIDLAKPKVLNLNIFLNVVLDYETQGKVY